MCPWWFQHPNHSKREAMEASLFNKSDLINDESLSSTALRQISYKRVPFQRSQDFEGPTSHVLVFLCCLEE